MVLPRHGKKKLPPHATPVLAPASIEGAKNHNCEIGTRKLVLSGVVSDFFLPPFFRRFVGLPSQAYALAAKEQGDARR